MDNLKALISFFHNVLKAWARCYIFCIAFQNGLWCGARAEGAEDLESNNNYRKRVKEKVHCARHMCSTGNHFVSALRAIETW